MKSFVLQFLVFILWCPISVFGFSGSREIRAIATHPSWYWKGTVAEKRTAMKTYFELAEQANLNLIYFWMETSHMAALLGEPKYADNPHYNFYATREWDCIAEMLDEGQARDIEIHLWFSFTRYKRTRTWVPEYDADPVVMPAGSPGWASVRKDEYLAGHTNPADLSVSGTALCNNEPAVTAWTIEVIDRILQRYPRIAGIHLEEPGYLDLRRCVCHRCQAVYETLYNKPGARLLEHIYSGPNAEQAYRSDPNAVAVKTAGTNAFVRRFRAFLHEKYPDKILMTGGGPNPFMERARGRNWPEWVQWGWIPYFGCQAYRPNVASFRRDIMKTMDAMTGSDCGFVPIVGVLYGSGPHANAPSIVTRQIQAARELDGYKGVRYAGIQLFSGRALTEELAQALRDGPFAEKKPLPWR